MRAEVPHYALVLWPTDTRSPACITLDGVAEAVQRGALVLAREDDILSPRVDRTTWQSNPKRHRYRDDEYS